MRRSALTKNGGRRGHAALAKVAKDRPNQRILGLNVATVVRARAAARDAIIPRGISNPLSIAKERRAESAIDAPNKLEA